MWFIHPCRDYNFVVIYAFFPPNSNTQIFRVDKKIAYSNSAHRTYRNLATIPDFLQSWPFQKFWKVQECRNPGMVQNGGEVNVLKHNNSWMFQNIDNLEWSKLKYSWMDQNVKMLMILSIKILEWSRIERRKNLEMPRI